jgi:putative ABC transport system substrate-binding protein
MMRRLFLAGLVGVAASPVGARAQQADKPLVGILSSNTPSVVQPLAAAFSSRMNELGWREGRDVVVDVRFAGGDFTKLNNEAGALIAAGAKVIVAVGTPALEAVQGHSRIVPVVFLMVSDPVGQKLIGSLSKPGGYATGLTNFEFSIGGKWVELLKEIDPAIVQATLIVNPANASTKQYMPAIAAASQAKGVEIVTAAVRDAADMERAIELASRKSGGSLIILPDALPTVHRALIIRLAEHYKLPAIYPFRDFAANGGLMSYGIDFASVYRQGASYVDKILRGAKPGELPVEAPNKFELAINLKTASALGLEVPLLLQQRADEVIE